MALSLLRNAQEHGLDAAHYGVEGLTRALEGVRDPNAVAVLDRDISTAMLQYLADLRFGRVSSGYRPYQGVAGEFVLLDHLRQALAEGGLVEAVESAAPQIPFMAGSNPLWHVTGS